MQPEIAQSHDANPAGSAPSAAPVRGIRPSVVMKTSLEHLPESKRLQIQAIADLLRTEAPVEMVILFGSYARGGWVEDLKNLYFSDYDILVVVATEQLAAKTSLWSDLAQRAKLIAGRIPVTLIVHDLKEINHEIRLGQYFFVDILREGILLYTSRRHNLARPKALEPADRLELGLINFRYWFASASGFWRLCGHSAGQGLLHQAAFLLHQATERYFHSMLLVFTGYKPKTHDIEKLAEQTAPLHPALPDALPRAQPEDKRLFDLLKRAYIEARYSKSYKITFEELRVLRERVLDLAVRVRQACVEKLGSFCGPDRVGELPDVPSIVDVGELPDAPAVDDQAAFKAWGEALAARSFERGKQAGVAEGFERGKEAGVSEGRQKAQIEALLTILATRGIAVDAEARSRIDACTDSTVLNQWIARATTVSNIEALFAEGAS